VQAEAIAEEALRTVVDGRSKTKEYEFEGYLQGRLLFTFEKGHLTSCCCCCLAKQAIGINETLKAESFSNIAPRHFSSDFCAQFGKNMQPTEGFLRWRKNDEDQI
jgi:hypothetical protein